MSICHFSSVVAASIPDVNPNISLVGQSFSSTRNTALGLGTATSAVIFNSDGEALERANDNVNTDATSDTDYNATDWWTNKPFTNIGDDFDIEVTITSALSGGTGSAAFSGPTGSQLSLSTTRIFQLTDEGNNVNTIGDPATIELQVELIDANTGITQATQTFTLTAPLTN